MQFFVFLNEYSSKTTLHKIPSIMLTKLPYIGMKQMQFFVTTMSAYSFLMKMGPALTLRAASMKAVLLYKATCKQLPQIITMYSLNLTVPQARKIVKSRFYENADIQDPRVAEILVYRGAMQLDEIVNQFMHEDNARMLFSGEPLRERDKFMAQKPDYLDQLLSGFEPNI